MNSINLSAFRDRGGEIRVNDWFVVTSIELSDLQYILGLPNGKIPTSFIVKGKEADIEVFPKYHERDDDGDVLYYRYQSKGEVMTKDGPRQVSITVYND